MGKERTTNSRLSFGKYRGKKLSECPTTYLTWMAEHMKDSEFHEWSYLAGLVLQERANSPDAALDAVQEDLDAAADRILREAGFNPKRVGPGRR